jgi:hypothetical protein
MTLLTFLGVNEASFSVAGYTPSATPGLLIAEPFQPPTYSTRAACASKPGKYRRRDNWPTDSHGRMRAAGWPENSLNAL